MLMDYFRRTNRAKMAAIGLAAGLAWAFMTYLFNINVLISERHLFSSNIEPIVSTILLPVLIGMTLSVVYMLVQNLLFTDDALFTLIEGAVLGGLGAVIWWIIPMFVFGLSSIWLSYTLIFGGAIIGPYYFSYGSFWLGPYLGAGFGGAVFCCCVALFSISIFRELLGMPAHMKRQHVKITMIVIGSFGALYGFVFAHQWLSNSFFD